MNHVKSHVLHPICDYLCLRVPAKPVDDLLTLNKQLLHMDLNSHESLVNTIRSLFADPVFDSALFTASRDLYHQFISLQASGFSDRKDTKKFFLSFYKYFSRMCTRPTPYGLFAGVAALTLSNEPTNIQFAEDKFRTTCELSIYSLVSTLRQLDPLDKSFLTKVRYFINKSHYILGDRLFFVEQFDKGSYWASNLTSIRYTEFVKAAVQAAEQGKTLPELAGSLPDASIDLQRKLLFINSLVKSQVLIPEYWPSVSSDDFMADLLNYFRDKDLPTDGLGVLKTAYSLTKEISGVGKVDLLKAETSSDDGDFFKVNLFLNLEHNRINEEPLQEICNMAQEVAPLFRPKTSDALENFIRAFESRYEAAEIPLMQAIDPNYGVGFGKVVNGFAEYLPLLENIPIIPAGSRNINLKETIRSKVQNKAFQLFMQTRQMTIALDNEIDKLRLEGTQEPARLETNTSSYIFGSLLASSAQDMDAGKYRFVPTQLFAPFASRLLSRFAYGDSDIKKQFTKIAQEEQENNPGAILAEVLTLPDDYYANVCLAPTARSYEIPFLSCSRLPKKQQITVEDLLVSVRDGRIVLRSGKLGKEVIPCFSNPYNTAFAQPVLKFLGDTSAQHMRLGDFWDWGQYHFTEKVLPRIEYKKIILARARWIVDKTIFNHNDEKAIDEFVHRIRTSLHVPAQVVLAQGDNELLLDLDSPTGRHLLAKQVNKTDVTLYESFVAPEHCFIKENGKSFTNELVIPIMTDKPYYPKFYSKNVTAKNAMQRIFPPGSEWLFVKVYTGSSNLEKLLTYVIGDFAKEAMAQKVIDQWFFIRYQDPEYHLRLRFHRHPEAAPGVLFGLVRDLQEKMAAVISEPYGFRLAIDTYVRELERYGERAIEPSERIFCADSIAIADFASLLSGNEGELLRWKFAFVNIDTLLTDFGYSITSKKRLLESLSHDFLQEFSHKKRKEMIVLAKALNDKHRKYRKEVSDFINRINTEELQEGFDCFERRSLAIRPQVPIISEAGGHDLDHKLASYIHMSLNRMFLVNQRRHELVIYYLLTQYYASIILKAKQVQL